MSELTDLNATGNGLAAVSGGLQGLLEAYKMKMAQQVEQAKISQQGLDAGANARAMATYRSALIGGKEAALAEKAREFDASGAGATPTLSADGKFITEKGRIVPVHAPVAGGAAQAKADTAMGMLDALSSKWDGLGAGTTTAGATLKGASLKAQSMAPSTAAGQYDAAAQAFAGKLDHDLLGRVNDLTISNAKKAIPGFFDTPESKKNKMDYIRGIYAQAPTASVAPAIHPAIAAALPGATPAPAAAPVAPGAGGAPSKPSWQDYAQ